MVYIIYIAAAVAVGLLIGFVTLSIMWLRKSVSENIRSKTVGLLSIYDDLLEEKSRELTAVESEIKKDGDTQTEADGAPSLVRTEASQPVTAPLRASELLNMAERTGGATYRDDTVGDLYRKVRGNFSFHVGELLPAFGTAPVSGGPAGRLLGPAGIRHCVPAVYDAGERPADHFARMSAAGGRCASGCIFGKPSDLQRAGVLRSSQIPCSRGAEACLPPCSRWDRGGGDGLRRRPDHSGQRDLRGIPAGGWEFPL